MYLPNPTFKAFLTIYQQHHSPFGLKTYTGKTFIQYEKLFLASLGIGIFETYEFLYNECRDAEHFNEWLIHIKGKADFDQVAGACFVVSTQVVEVSLDISQIRRDGGTQSRAKIDEATVAELVDAMSDQNNIFPPVEVYYDGTDYWLADGFHRLEAWERIGRTTKLPVNIRPGDRRRAILHSLKANTKHGLRRSNEDKRHSVMMLLVDPEWSQWPQGKIAEACVVSREFVNRISQEMSASCDRSQDTTRNVDRSGKAYRQNTTNIGKTKSEVGADAPPKPNSTVDGALELNPDQDLESRATVFEEVRNALPQQTRDALEVELVGLRAELAEAMAQIDARTTEIERLKAQCKRAGTIVCGLANERDQEKLEKLKAVEEQQRLQVENDGLMRRIKELEETHR
ncbi:hypothetical protein EON80_12020 [bacterium]|nr:MAG: hypothetical protein EON80_12020 [bacterium]